MEEINGLLINWYLKNRRSLPWRENKNAYRIWLSEIILQQTQVVQGTDYFLRFTERFDNVFALAEASPDEVMKLWQGLGYYSRARNLHATAKIIVADYNGKFPADYNLLLKLKGVGPYTAAAIASIAFNLPHAVLDGNVFRVLSRLFGLDTAINSSAGVKQFNELATALLKRDDAGTYNQAIMEFGALYCTPSSPDCSNCILHHKCVAFSTKQVANLPVKLKKVKQRYRYFYFFHFDYNNSSWLIQRNKKDIWQELFQFPMLEQTEAVADKVAISEMFNQLNITNDNSVILNCKTTEIKHILSHQILIAKGFSFQIKSDETLKRLKNKYGEPIPLNELYHRPVSRLMEIIMEQLIKEQS